MLKAFKEQFKQASITILPTAILVVAISLSVGITDGGLLRDFFIGTILLLIGLTVFWIGQNNSLTYLAENMGRVMVKKRNLLFYAIVAFAIGFAIIFAEPSLHVVSDQVKNVIDPMLLLFFVSLSSALFFTFTLLRILFNLSYRIIITIAYVLVAILGLTLFQLNPDMVPMALDMGSITTGLLSFPFVVSLGYGISSERGDLAREEDSFGIAGMMVLGPILGMFILGFIRTGSSFGGGDFVDLTTTIPGYFFGNLQEISYVILIFVIFFLVFNKFFFKLDKVKTIKVLVGFLYTYLGVVLFLTGANGGLVKIGFAIGQYFGGTNAFFALMIGVIVGLVVALAEPSVHSLAKQIEQVSGGSIKPSIIFMAISLATGIAIGLAYLRSYTGFNIFYIVVPVLIIVILLTMITPKLYMTISYDAGGSVTGPMSTAFLMPLSSGISSVVIGGNILLDAFGMIMLMSMMPVIIVQIFGIIVERRIKEKRNIFVDKDEIITLSGGR